MVAKPTKEEELYRFTPARMRKLSTELNRLTASFIITDYGERMDQEAICGAARTLHAWLLTPEQKALQL